MKELLLLIDWLEDTVEDAKSEPLTGHARVDRQDVYAIVDQIGRAVPEEIKQARWIAKEREEILAEAKREAERIVDEARQQSSRLLAAEEITKLAERRAAKIIDKARSPERDIRRGAEAHADEILKSLESYFERFAAAVQRGRDRLPVQSVQRSAIDRGKTA